MGDVRCGVCREPWESYSLIEASCGRDSDLCDTDSPAERRRLAGMFKRGLGCPSCGWGEWCPECEGTGRRAPDWGDRSCDVCHGSGSFRGMRQVSGPGADPSRWFLPYRDRLPSIPEGAVVCPAIKPERIVGRTYANGGAEVGESRRFLCPCGAGELCEGCGGEGTRAAWDTRNGAAAAAVADRADLRAVAVELLGDDEDGLAVTLEDMDG